MKQITTAFGVAAACWALSGGVQAQSTTGSQGGSTGSQGGSMSGMHSQPGKSGKTIRLTGCVQADPGGDGYIMTNVTESDSSSISSSDISSSGSMSGSGTDNEPLGTSGTRATANSVELVGKSSELKSLVGQRVEVTGTPSGRSSKLSDISSGSGMSGSDSTSGTGQSGTTGSEQTGSMSGSSGTIRSNDWRGQKIRVESVRQVASSCPAQ